MLEEKISKTFDMPYVNINTKTGEFFLCENGVLFSSQEFLNCKDPAIAFEEKLKQGILFDYEYAKKRGRLRKQQLKENKEENYLFLILLLGITSLISMFVSTIHTSTYLSPFVGKITSIFMSASVTIYNSTAFEASILFFKKNKKFLGFVFIFLWLIVTLFSMITTVSIFYDKYNVSELLLAKQNQNVYNKQNTLEILQKQEASLMEDIKSKLTEMEFRQKQGWATATLRNEINSLQNKIQENLENQKNVSVSETSFVKETLFSYLSKIFNISQGILEFIMGSLCAIFINLISPLSLTAVIELNHKGGKNAKN